MNIVYCSTEQTALLALLWIINRRLLSPTNEPALQRQFTFPILPYYNESDTASHPLPLTPRRRRISTQMPPTSRMYSPHKVVVGVSEVQSNDFPCADLICYARPFVLLVESVPFTVSQMLTTPCRAQRDVTSDNTTVGLSELQANKHGC